MLYRTLTALHTRRNRWLFERVSAQILMTKPLAFRSVPDVTVVSMVGHETVNMYLIAVKSFMIFFCDASIEVIDDGTLTSADRDAITHHLPGVQISRASDVDTLSCPSYSSWKRLFRIVELSQSSYVVQLDSDTITRGPLTEVYLKAQANAGFMIGDGLWGEPIDLYHMHSIARRWKVSGPQSRMEQVIHQLQFFERGDRYLHGCAGFAGYPRGSLAPRMVEELSNQIEERLGRDNWHRWGSEQAASICLISKSKNSSNLPWPKYRNYMFPPTTESTAAASFLHFLGTHRFHGATYVKLAQNFILHYKNNLIV